jgi:hypothetical protein
MAWFRFLLTHGANGTRLQIGWLQKEPDEIDWELLPRRAVAPPFEWISSPCFITNVISVGLGDAPFCLKTINMLAAVVLLVSAAVGTYILTTDSYLWAQAPTHADGLIAFTVIDVALVLGLWWKPKLSVIGMTLLALIQFGAMGADIFVGTMTFGGGAVAQSGFQTYLLGDTAFKVLLGVQIVLIVIGVMALLTGRRTPPASIQRPSA